MLKRQGAYQVLRALRLNRVIKEVNLADNQINEDEEFVKFLAETLEENSTIRVLDLTFNKIQ